MIEGGFDMEFNEKLQLLRSQRGLTQEELAEKIFVSRTAVSKWESGRGYPSIDSLKELAKFFEVTVDVLISEKELSEMLTRERRMREREWSYAARIRTIACGVLDICALVFLFMPLFINRVGCIVSHVSILEYTGTSLRPLYLGAIFGTVAVGVISLLIQAVETVVLKRAVIFFSVIASLGLLLLFIAGGLLAAVVLASLLSVIKAFFLIKRW